MNIFNRRRQWKLTYPELQGCVSTGLVALKPHERVNLWKAKMKRLKERRK